MDRISINKAEKTPDRPKVVGYLRISTGDQEVEKNKAAILTLANDLDLGKVTFVEEIISGKVNWRKRKIAAVLEGMNRGDSIVVSELSRLGRSMLEIMEILSVSLSAGVHIFALKGNWKLDDSIQSKIIAMAFSMAAEIERDLISSRTKEALRHRVALGMKLGRPRGPGKSKLDAFRPEIEALLNNGSTQAFIAKRYKTTTANLSNYLKKTGLRR